MLNIHSHHFQNVSTLTTYHWSHPDLHKSHVQQGQRGDATIQIFQPQVAKKTCKKKNTRFIPKKLTQLKTKIKDQTYQNGLAQFCWTDKHPNMTNRYPSVMSFCVQGTRRKPPLFRRLALGEGLHPLVKPLGRSNGWRNDVIVRWWRWWNDGWSFILSWACKLEKKKRACIETMKGVHVQY